MDIKKAVKAIEELTGFKMFFELDHTKGVFSLQNIDEINYNHFSLTQQLHTFFNERYIEDGTDGLCRVNKLLDGGLSLWTKIKKEPFYITATLKNQEQRELENRLTKEDLLRIADVKLYYIEELIQSINEMAGKDRQQKCPAQPQQNEISDIENKFDHVDISKVYDYFNKELVKADFLTDTQLKQYLKAAFERKEPPKDRFTFKNDPQKSVIRKIFYKYYKDVAARGRRKEYRKECASLLGEYFNDYNTKTVLNNFNK